MLKGIIKRGVICSIAALLCVMPFSFIASAATFTPEIIGVDSVLTSVTGDSGSSGVAYYYNYQVTVYLDRNYIGSIVGTLNYSFWNVSSSSYTATTYAKSSVVNGSTFTFGISIGSSSRITPVSVNLSNLSYSISSSNLVPNDNLAYSFPVESMNFICSMDSYGFIPDSFNTLDYSVYPIYNLRIGDEFIIATVNPANEKANDYTLIFGCNRNVYNAASFDTVLQHSSTNQYSNYTFEYVETLYRNNLAPFSIVKAHLFSNDDQTQTVRFKSNQDMNFMPIYANYTPLINISTDFALRFNLNNRLLLDIEAFNQGNQVSQSAGDNIDAASSSLDNASDQLHQMDTQYLNNMSDQMNNIDFTGDGVALINNGNFLSSANWVRTQFNRMTSNNVFGTMIYFSLVLGLSLLVLGKLRK